MRRCIKEVPLEELLDLTLEMSSGICSTINDKKILSAFCKIHDLCEKHTGNYVVAQALLLNSIFAFRICFEARHWNEDDICDLRVEIVNLLKMKAR